MADGEPQFARVLAPAFKPAAILIAAIVAAVGLLIGGLSMFDSMLGSRIQRAIESSPQATLGAKLELIELQERSLLATTELLAHEERLGVVEKRQQDVLQALASMKATLLSNAEALHGVQDDMRELLRLRVAQSLSQSRK